ncbi:MAG TPA: hypothetical protein VK760_04060 [Candidatus Acidoferrales bacterium]|jgi:hypothetical protein|nr:hypothetical protein [Candidatus Acidoferrales bacterium]
MFFSLAPLRRASGAAALLLAAATALPAAASTHKHSMAEYAYLIGSWHCVASVPGKGKVPYTTVFHWKYPSHGAIDQSFDTAKGQADFMLAYDAASDSFKGIWIDSHGSTGYWEDPGIVNGGWTELGYAINGAHQSPNTRAVFSGVTPTHYGFVFSSITSKDDSGKLIETDSCDKDAR